MAIKGVDGHTFLISDVYYGAQINGTIISQGALLEKGAKLSFKGEDIDIENIEGVRVIASLYKRRWWLTAKNKAIGAVPGKTVEGTGVCEVRADLAGVLLWHKCFGNVSMKRLRTLCIEKMGLGLPENIPSVEFTCDDCLKYKSMRTCFLGSTNRNVGKLDIVVSDVAGPFLQDFHGARFLVTFRDVATSFSNVVVIKQKSDVELCFTRLITRWERETGYVVKVVRSDGGGEYMRTIFSNWLKDKGIHHEQPVPYKPEQNGIAERLNRTLGDMARTMLAASGLPKTFWSYAYLCACYLHNRIPNEVTKRMTPYEAFYNRKPQLDIIRTFGAVGFVHILEQQRKSKLDQRARRCRMVGYLSGGKGWLFFDEIGPDPLRAH